MEEDNVQIITPQGVNPTKFSKKSIIISVGIIFVILAIVIAIAIIPRGSKGSSEDMYEKFGFERPSTNAPCYEDLEEISGMLEDSCSNESLLAVIDSLASYQKKYIELPNGEGCARTMSNFSLIMMEVCGEDSLNRTMDLVTNKMMKELDTTSCFDAVGMIGVGEATRDPNTDSITFNVRRDVQDIKLVGIQITILSGNNSFTETWRENLPEKNTQITKTFTREGYGEATEMSISPIIDTKNGEKICTGTPPIRISE